MFLKHEIKNPIRRKFKKNSPNFNWNFIVSIQIGTVRLARLNQRLKLISIFVFKKEEEEEDK